MISPGAHQDRHDAHRIHGRLDGCSEERCAVLVGTAPVLRWGGGCSMVNALRAVHEHRLYHRIGADLRMLVWEGRRAAALATSAGTS